MKSVPQALGISAMIKAEMDVALEIQSMQLKGFWIQRQTIKVTSHIEQEDAPDKFLWECNALADALATKARDECDKIAGEAMHQYYLQKYDWTPTTFAKIAWEAHGREYHKYNRNNQVTLTKFIHGWLANNRKSFREGRSLTPCCPLCGMEDHQEHIFQCGDNQMQQIRSGLWKKLSMDVSSTTASGYKEIFLAGLGTIIGYDPPTSRDKQSWLDLTKVFKLMHKLQKTISVSNIPVENHPLKNRISKSFKKLQEEGRLNLKSLKVAHFIDFISSVPKMTAKAVTRNNIIHGFRANGMIDDTYERFPDFKKILSTCQKNPTESEYKLCVDSFPYLFKKYLEDGHVDDHVFENLGFPMDEDVDARKVRRDSGIKQENRQRAKVLTHNHQVELRAQIQDEMQQKLKKKAADKISVLERSLILNDECESKMCQMMGREDRCEDILKNINHEIIVKCNSDELRAFITGRNLDLPVSKLPNKGNISNAIQGETNLISIAYNYCSLPNLLRKQLLEEEDNGEFIDWEETNNRSGNKDIFTIVNINNAQDGSASFQLTPSSLLANSEWVKNVFKCFAGSEHQETANVSQEQIDQCEHLYKNFSDRLTCHIFNRIEDKNKHDHWGLKWASKNLPHIATIMILMGHIKQDIECSDENTTLLETPNRFKWIGNINNNIINYIGSYLYFDINDNKWVRSGKSTGTGGFISRHKQHEKHSKWWKGASSKFYLQYPSKTVTHTKSSNKSRRGYSENLRQFMAIGYDSKNEETMKTITTRYGEGGMFEFDDNEMKKIEKTNLKGKTTVNLKMIDMISYLPELAYDLSISRADNVSINPGFESILGVW